jgi:acyl-coenzyme A synthetase/AMP-(fatty) acid ligase
VQTVTLDEQCKPVVGKVGELAVLNAWPGMTKGFWQDPQPRKSPDASREFSSFAG